MYPLLTVIRDVVFGAFCAAGAVASAGWLVRTRRVSPFSGLGRLLRRASDPVLVPVETRVVRLGGSPTHAGWWLVVGTAVGGLLLIALTRTVIDVLGEIRYAAQGGIVEILRFLVGAAYDVLLIALIVRVVGSWFGAFRYARWARPAYVLTDWLVEPIRKVLPPFGALDWSPLVAWLVLYALRAFLVSVVL
ncbi:MAG TPA: YggT family protein [Gemmatimonadales bacterium]|nr:YggT family protein [Gemmatimonadales bacterium]